MTTIVRYLSILIFSILLSFPAFAGEARLVLLHFNDVYKIAPMAQLMTLLEDERGRAKHHLTTVGGDFIPPSLMSGISKGAHMIELLNAVKVDVAGLGNHEFDFGVDVLQQRIAESKFTWLASNMSLSGVEKTRLFKVEGFTIGMFSLLTVDVKRKTSGASDLIISPVKEAAKRAVRDLKSRGADIIIALTHQDVAEDRELARNVKGINVILGGHDHVPYDLVEGGVLILKAGTNANFLAVADLALKREDDGKTTILTQSRMLATNAVAADPEIAKIVNGLEARLDKSFGQPVGVTSVELDSRSQTVRTRSSAIGELIADAMRESVNADVALMNGGGIRGGRVYGAGTALLRKDILGELPFSNVTILVEISGADLLAAVENGVSSVAHADGRFPHLSGMSAVYDPGLEKGARVLEVYVGGQALDKAKTYRLATNDFLYNGGDGYTMLKKGKLIINASDATLLTTAVIDYIAKNSPVAPKPEGRVVGK